MKNSNLSRKSNIRSALLFGSCILLSCAFCLPASLRGDDPSGDSGAIGPSDIPAVGAPQGKEFPSSVGLYVWTEGISANAGAVELKAASEILIKLAEYQPESDDDRNQYFAPIKITRCTDLSLSGTASAGGQLIQSGTTVYLPVSTQQEISFHDITTSNLSKFKVHVNAPSEYAVYFYNKDLGYYEESSAYEYNPNEWPVDKDGNSTSQILFFVKLKKEQGMPAGRPLDVMPGESTLRIGLGYLPNGHSAGYLDFSPVVKYGSRDVMGTSLMDIFGVPTRMDLQGRISAPFYYFPTSPDVKLVFELFTSSYGKGARRLKQIKTPSVLVDIIRKNNDGTDYIVNFYDASKTMLNNGVYTFTSAPFVSYEFTTKWDNAVDNPWDWQTYITRKEGGVDAGEAFFKQTNQTATVYRKQETPIEPNCPQGFPDYFDSKGFLSCVSDSIKSSMGDFLDDQFLEMLDDAYFELLDMFSDGDFLYNYSDLLGGYGDDTDSYNDNTDGYGDDTNGYDDDSDGYNYDSPDDSAGEDVNDDSTDEGTSAPGDECDDNGQDDDFLNNLKNEIKDGIMDAFKDFMNGNLDTQCDPEDYYTPGMDLSDFCDGEPIYEVDEVPYQIYIPRKSISITGFNGERTEFRASDYEDAQLPQAHFNGDSYQIARTDASMRLVGRYGADRTKVAADGGPSQDGDTGGGNGAAGIVSTFGENIVELSGGNDAWGDWADNAGNTGDNAGSPAYISTREIAYQFTGTVNGTLNDFLPDLPNGNYGYRTDREYYDIDLSTGKKYPGRLFWEENPDRSWSMFSYYTDLNKRGLIGRVVMPFGDTARPSAMPNNTKVSGYCVKTIDYAADWNGAVRLPALEENWVNGTRVSWVNHAYAQLAAVNGQPVWQATTTTYAASNTSVPLTSIAKVYQGNGVDPLYRGLPFSMQAADGTKTCYAYERGTVNEQGGFASSSTGGAFRSIMVTGVVGSGGSISDSNQKIDGISLVDGRSTRIDTVRNEWGLVVCVKTYVYDAGMWALLDTEKRAYDASSNLVSTENSTGKAEYEYTINGRLQSCKDASGVTMQYTYDQFGHVTSTTRLGMGNEVPELGTRFTYDADGRVTSKITGTEFDEKLESTYAYNYAGQLTSKTEQGITTTYSYATSSDGAQILSVTETHADNSTITTTKNRDGTIKSKTGTAIVPEYYTYTVEGVNLAVKTSYGSSNSPRWGKTWKDGLGRDVQAQVPLAAGTSTAQNTYNNKGQITQTTTSGYAATLYGYDQMGVLTDTMIGGASGRRNSATVKIVQDNGAWWSYNETIVYPVAGSSGVTSSKTWTRLTGFDSVSIPQNSGLLANGKVVSEVITQDAAGNKTRNLALVDRDTGSRYDISTIAVGSSPSVSLSRGGLVIKSVSSSGVTSSISYDELCRPKRIEDRTSAGDPPYNGKHIFYVPNTTRKDRTYNDLGILMAKFTYDSMGRVIASSAPTVAYSSPGVPSNPSEGSLNTTNFEYNSRGQTIRVYGNATNPVSYEFDPTYGDLIKQTTYRDDPSASGASSDKTSFTRNPVDGSLTSRTDAKGKTASFTYNIRGQIDMIKSARTIGSLQVSGSYGYDGSTGDLLSTTYNDGTPSITYAYDRMGRVTTVKDATGTRNFTYNSDMSIGHEYLGQTAPGVADSNNIYGNANLSINYSYGPMNGAASVKTKFTLTADAAGRQDYTFSVTRDAQTGRLASIISDAGTYNFMYQADSDYIRYIGATGGTWGQTRTYEDHRDLLAGITTLYGTETTASYDYTNDGVGRRSQVAQSGQIYDPYCSGGKMITQYQYDNCSQITASVTRISATGEEVKGRNFGYAYDVMGNRITETANGEPLAYHTNELNQYTYRDTSATVAASGIATPGTKVEVDGIELSGTGDWQGQYFYKAVPKNPADGGLQNIAFTAEYGGQTYESTYSFFVHKQQNEPFTYDEDGNMLADSLWSYTYNAADQLTQAISAVPDQTGKRVLIQFTYDYMGRRAAKQVYDADANGLASNLRSKTVFVYEGWTLIAEYDATSTSSPNLTRTYTWGPDLTGGTDAGGIGGLLAIQDYQTMTAGTYNPSYDGNGNVTALVNASTGELAAAYEYDPYGNAVRISGAYAFENPIRFSSKYQDDETGLSYFGFRYYSPSMGRFLNRDPLMEDGGINIYAFTANNPISRRDCLGMDWTDETGMVHRDVINGSYAGTDANGSYLYYTNNTMTDYAFFVGSTGQAGFIHLHDVDENGIYNYELTSELFNVTFTSDMLKGMLAQDVADSLSESIRNFNDLPTTWHDKDGSSVTAGPMSVVDIAFYDCHTDSYMNVGSFGDEIAGMGANIVSTVNFFAEMGDSTYLARRMAGIPTANLNTLYANLEDSWGVDRSSAAHGYGDALMSAAQIAAAAVGGMGGSARSLTEVGAADSKFIPNPGGKLGDAITRQTTANVIKNLKVNGFSKVSQEVKFAKGPLGDKARFADVVGTNPQTGESLIINIGKQTKSGIPIMRERLALDDIIFSPTIQNYPNSRVLFIPKGSSALPSGL